MSPCLNAGGMGRIDAESETLIPTGGFFDVAACDVADSLTVGANQTTGFCGDVVAHSLRAEGFDASKDGTGRGTPLVIAPDTAQTLTSGGTGARGYLDPVNTDLIAFSVKDHGADAGPLSPTPRSGGHDKSHANGGVMPASAIGLDEEQNAVIDGFGTLKARQDGGGFEGSVMTGMQVRRLTPRECERLQGFRDDYTLIPYRNKPAADGPRYKALGNSMAVSCMAWIGRRIQTVSDL